MRKKIFVVVLFFLLLIIPNALAAVKSFHVQENDLVTITPETLDPDDDQVIYTYSLPLDKNGQWQTGYDDAGEYLLKIAAFDGINTTTKEVLLIVDNKNQPPYLKEKKVTVKELQPLDLKKLVADPDEDPLEYVFAKPFDGKGFWTPGYDDQGTYIIKFSARDGEFTIPMRVEVEVLNTNQPPKLLSSFSDSEEVSVKENEKLSFYAEAVDGDKDPVSYSWALNGQPLSQGKKGEYLFTYDSKESYELVLTVSDGVNTGNHQLEKKWLIKVGNVNRKPKIDLSPITVTEGEIVSLPLPSEDADGNQLTYTFDERFDQSGTWLTGYRDEGTYNVQYTVSDGSDKVKETVEVTVLNLDRAPELHLPEMLEVKEGENLSVVVDASDPDGDAITIALENAPEGSLYDQKSKTFSWSPGFDYIHRRGGMLSNILNALRLEQRILHDKKIAVKVTACSLELCSTGNVPITVYNSNRAPVLQLPQKLTVTEGELVQLETLSSDPDGDIVRYYFSEPVQKRNGQWQTSYEDAGEHTVYVTGTDGSSSQTLPVTVKVLEKNRQPTIIVPHDQYNLQEGKEFVLPVKAFDQDDDSLSLQVENLPRGAVFKNNTFTWTPSYNFAAAKNVSENSLLSEASFLKEAEQEEYWISFVVSDKEYDVKHPVKLIVKNVNQKPALESFVPQPQLTAAVGQPLLFSVNVVDHDFANLTYTWKFAPGNDVITGSNTVERTFVSPGEKKVSVVVSDGRSEVSQEWKVTVPEPEAVPHNTTAAVVPSLTLEEPHKFRVYVINY